MSDDSGRSNALARPAGPRTTHDTSLVAVEQDLAVDGQPVDNPAVPLWLFDGCASVDDYRAIAAAEADSDAPRQHIIGYANRQIRWLTGGEGEDGEVSDE